MLRLSFMEQLIQGQVQPEDVTKFRQEWSRYENNSTDLPCYTYLGMTYNEYVATQGGSNVEALMKIVAERRMYRHMS